MLAIIKTLHLMMRSKHARAYLCSPGCHDNKHCDVRGTDSLTIRQTTREPPIKGESRRCSGFPGSNKAPMHWIHTLGLAALCSVCVSAAEAQSLSEVTVKDRQLPKDLAKEVKCGAPEFTGFEYVFKRLEIKKASTTGWEPLAAKDAKALPDKCKGRGELFKVDKCRKMNILLTTRSSFILMYTLGASSSSALATMALKTHSNCAWLHSSLIRNLFRIRSQCCPVLPQNKRCRRMCMTFGPRTSQALASSSSNALRQTRSRS
jgi:hypothetical protein